MKKSLKLYDIQKSLMSSIVGSNSDSLAHIVFEKPPISISQRIGIYQDAYYIRMLESLRDDFSRVQKRLGSEEFEHLALLFIEKYPSSYASLAEVSQHFPQFTKEISDELHELASLDWIEILSDTAKRLGSEKIATLQDVESGVPFKLIQNPTLFVFKGKKRISIAYCDSNSVSVKEVTPAELEILDILIKSMTVDELSNHLEKFQMKFEEVQLVISSWIKNEIILCERVSYV